MFPIEIDPNLDDVINAILIGTATLVTAIVTQIVFLIKSRHDTKRQLEDHKEELEKVTTEVKNDHQNNLREDIDLANRTAVEAAAEARLAKESSYRAERWLADIKTSLRAMDRSRDLQSEIVNTALGEMNRAVKQQQIKTSRVQLDLEQHLDDVPRILEEWNEKREARHAREHKEEDKA